MGSMPVDVWPITTGPLGLYFCICIVIISYATTRKPVVFLLSSNMHMYDAFGNHIVLSYLCHLCIPCLADRFLFPLFMPINFNIIHTCISVHNTNAYLVLCDSHKYFHLAAVFDLSYQRSLMYSFTERCIALTVMLCNAYI